MQLDYRLLCIALVRIRYRARSDYSSPRLDNPHRSVQSVRELLRYELVLSNKTKVEEWVLFTCTIAKRQCANKYT